MTRYRPFTATINNQKHQLRKLGISPPGAKPHGDEKLISKRKPLLTLKAFTKAHKKQAAQMSAYFDKAFSRKLAPVDRAELGPKLAMFLFANNMSARIEFARIASEHIGRKLEAVLGDEAKGYWITLSPSQFRVAEADAKAFNVRRIHSWVHQELRGLDYIGMLDLALFTNVQLLYGRKRAVHFHVHLIAWGCGEAVIEHRIEYINRRYAPFITGQTAAHYKPYLRDALLGRVFYMSKAPMSEYRIVPDKREVHDAETGEVVIDGAFRPLKDRLSPIDITKLYEITAHRWVDKLAFAGGDGRAVLDDIRKEALAPLGRYIARRPRGLPPVE